MKVLFIVLALTFCSASSYGKTLSTKYVLSYNQLMKLKPAVRAKYLKGVARALIKLDSSKTSFHFNLLLQKAWADGSVSYKCFGGGVPITSDQSRCGVSSYAGFSCANDLEICNPLIFGLKPNGEPHCYENAITTMCYQNIITGTSGHFDDEKFQSEEVKNAYREFSQAVNNICSGQATFQGDNSVKQLACHQVKRQMELNTQRNLRVPDSRAEQAKSDIDKDKAVADANSCQDPKLTAAMPTGTKSGSSIRAQLPNAGGSTRSCKILSEVSAPQGGLPEYLKNLVPVTIGEITICVLPDYLAFGDDQDNIRAPLGRDEAVEIANDMNFMLPTTKMVDAIYGAATKKLNPSPKTPNNQMETTQYFVDHDSTIDQQLGSSHPNTGELVAGHKKDIVVDRLDQTSKVPIYGWHRQNGQPIQPLTTVHGKDYADYSHGIRLISQTAFVNGQPVDLKSLLRDPKHHGSLGSVSSGSVSAFDSAPSDSGCFKPQSSSEIVVQPESRIETVQ